MSPHFAARFLALAAALIAGFSSARADIFQWEYVDPGDPSQGKQQSTTLAPDGAGVDAQPFAFLIGRNLTKAYLINANLSFAQFDGSTLVDAEFSDATLVDANFGLFFEVPVDLTKANFSRANLTRAFLWQSILTDADLTDAEVRDAQITSASGFTASQLYSTSSYKVHDLSGLGLDGMDLTGWNFAGQNLTEVTFFASTLAGVNVAGANLTRTNFTLAALPGVDLHEALFADTVFIQTTLTNADFHGADLTTVNLTSAILTGANFAGAQVQGAGFEYSNLSVPQLQSTASYAAHDLSGIRLSYTVLSGAQLSGQDLTGASLSGATLLATNFSQANLTQTQFDGATLTAANFSGSTLREARFGSTTSHGFTQGQLISTASYQAGDLRGLVLDHNTMTAWNFASKNLQRADFSYSILQDADFQQADLNDANFQYATLTGANFTGADVRGADFRVDASQTDGLTAAQLDSTASYLAHDLRGIVLAGHDLQSRNFAGQNLSQASFWQANLTSADFGGADLTGSNFSRPAGGVNVAGANLTDANFIDAEIRGAFFGHTTGFTLAQLYSTASYQALDLTGVNFNADFAVDGINFTDAEFGGQNLTDAGFQNARLGSANFSGAWIRGAHFGSTVEQGFTAAQLYSTASYQAHDLVGIRLPNNILSDWNFAGQNLTRANLSFANLHGADLSQANLANVYFFPFSGTLAEADLSGADARGSDLQEAMLAESITRNLIRANGHLPGVDLTGGAVLVIRDFDGNPTATPPIGPLPIVIEQGMAMDATGTLRLVFDADAWNSTISFAPGISATLGGTLELDFAADVDLASQVGRTIDAFDWDGATRTGTFNVSSPYTWDLSRLYTTGEITLLEVPEPTTLGLLGVGAVLLAARVRWGRRSAGPPLRRTSIPRSGCV